MALGLQRISSHELAEWSAEYSIEPFGDVRGDLQAGIVAATIANVNRDPDKKSKPFTAVDFMPDFEGVSAETGQTWEQQLAIVQMMNAALGGPDLEV